MGNKNLQSKIISDLKNRKSLSNDDGIVSRSSFEYINIIGRGGFGKVWKVIEKKKNKLYAMKEMSKAKIIDKKSISSVKNERDFLSKMHHPFIVNMHYAFQDNENLYLVMDLLTGGDLRYQACKYRKFTENQTRYFLACIILSLEYCHTNNIIHRDIKPENLVLDSEGRVHLTDFGIAKMFHENNAKDTSGTPGYMSPEVMCGLNHTIAADYFALGVIGYEFMNGYRPYLGNSRKEIKEKIMAKQVRIKIEDVIEGWSFQAVDCINKLLIRKPSKRIGYHGAREVKEHPWFKNFPWKELYVGKLSSPFVPKSDDNYDFKYCNAIEKIGMKTRERYNEILNSESFPTVFEDYYYYSREMKNEQKSNIEGKFINPHLMYEIEYDMEIQKESGRLSRNDIYKNLAPSHSAGEMHNQAKKKINKSYVMDSQTIILNNTNRVLEKEGKDKIHLYYKKNKNSQNYLFSTYTKSHQRNFSSNSTNFNSLK